MQGFVWVNPALSTVTLAMLGVQEPKLHWMYVQVCGILCEIDNRGVQHECGLPGISIRPTKPCHYNITIRFASGKQSKNTRTPFDSDFCHSIRGKNDRILCQTVGRKSFKISLRILVIFHDIHTRFLSRPCWRCSLHTGLIACLYLFLYFWSWLPSRPACPYSARYASGASLVRDLFKNCTFGPANKRLDTPGLVAYFVLSYWYGDTMLSLKLQFCYHFFIALSRFNMYSVAQNKIPHRRICNISATSCLILKILEAA